MNLQQAINLKNASALWNFYSSPANVFVHLISGNADAIRIIFFCESLKTYFFYVTFVNKSVNFYLSIYFLVARQCVISCTGLPNGDYQSCQGCNVYATCSNSILYDNRPCPADLVWDDDRKRCELTSTTCQVNGTQPSSKYNLLDFSFSCGHKMMVLFQTVSDITSVSHVGIVTTPGSVGWQEVVFFYRGVGRDGRRPSMEEDGPSTCMDLHFA